MVGLKEQVVESYASDVITWTEEDRLTQLATGVARTADVFTLADHTFRAGEILQAFLPDGSIQDKVELSTTYYSLLLLYVEMQDGRL
jgi:hypothetical protein